MNAALAHRGEDGEGFWSDHNGLAHLAHRRLAIIDTSLEGAQPMHYLGRYTIIHNGEIYNYPELRELLEKSGYTFHTKTDTEVIVAAYDKFGSDCLAHFDGMFAFVIWDQNDAALFAARDRMGEKPFYYYWDEQRLELLFASEPKAIKAAGIRLEVDPAQALLFMGAGLTEPAHKGTTYYKGLKQLPAGHFLSYLPLEKSETPRIHLWWHLEKNRKEIIPVDKINTSFKELLQDSINKRLRSDVELGTSLSGGIDSSTIAAILHRELGEKKNASLKTFTVGFKGFEKDESEKAKKLADELGFVHCTKHLDQGPTVEELIQLIKHHEEPIGSSSVWAQYKLYELAKENGVSVLLDGQGADELFAGYARYLHWYLQELLDEFKFRKFFREKKALQKNYPVLEWNWKNIPAAFLSEFTAQTLQERVRKNIQDNPFLSKDFVEAHLNDTTIEKPIVRELDDLLIFDCTSNGLPDLLRYADRNSMAHGVEVRLPYLQHQLVELAFSMPPDLKIHNGFTKWILRQEAATLLSPSIAWQTEKIGLEPPQKKWMENTRIREAIRESREQLVQQGIADPSIRNAAFDSSGAYGKENFDWRTLVVGNL